MKIHINKGQQAWLKDYLNLYISIQQIVVIDVNQTSLITKIFKKQQNASQNICFYFAFTSYTL